KAHKSPQVARRQMDLGALGIICAKPSEAEVMVDHGIPSVLIANEQGRRSKYDRIAALNRRAEVITCADNPIHVEMASAAGRDAGTYMTSGTVSGMTEVQAGGGCFLDRFYGEECHMHDEFEYALSVISTVTSRPIPERGIMDAGFKTMSDGESGRPRPLDRPGMSLVYLSAEHGNLALEPEAQGLAIGDRIERI